jgi:hypothetical protein
MSIGSFADRASREHLKLCRQQKEIVFGLRPSTINASATMAPNETPDLNTAPESKNDGSAHQELEGVNTKKKSAPWILAPDNTFLSSFNCTVYWLSLPLTMMHIYVIAFGFKVVEEGHFFLITYIMEAFFCIDILLHFLT